MLPILSNMRTSLIIILFFSFFYGQAQVDKHSALKIAKEQLDDKEYDAALELLCEIISSYPDFDSAYIERGYLYLNKGLPTESLSDLDKAIEIDSNNMSAYFVRAISYGVIQNYSRAFSDYNHIVTFGDNKYYFLALKERAILFDYFGETEKALEDFNLLYKADTTDIEIVTAIGLMHTRNHDYDLALTFYNNALILNPNYVDALHKRSITYEDKMLFRNALDDINKAIILDSKNTSLYLTRASIYRDLDKKDLALIDFDYVINKEPNNGLAYLNRGYLKQELSDKKGANVDFRKAESLGYNR